MRQEALAMVYELAKSDKRIVFIGSDLGAGTLEDMRQDLPSQFFMEGISEQHVVGFAAGLAKEGFIPFINTIGTFISRRAYEQVCIDVALHNLPVRFLAGGGGMVYAPLGPTHTSIEDLSIMLSIPGLQVFAPADAIEMQNIIRTSISDLRPYYIRFGKGGEKTVTESFHSFDFIPKVFGPTKSTVVICTTGVVLQSCLDAQKILNYSGIDSTVIHFPYLNSLRLEMFNESLSLAQVIVCVEEHVSRGGLLSHILHDALSLDLRLNRVIQLSLPLSFSHKYGSQEDHFKLNNLHGEGIANQIQRALLK